MNEQEDVFSNSVERNNLFYLAEDGTAKAKLEQLEQSATETEHKIQL